MATLTATYASTGDQPTANCGVHVAYGEYEISQAVAGGDIFEMVRLPKGAVILDWCIGFDDLDTDGSPTIRFDVGITGVDATLLLANNTTARSGGMVYSLGIDAMLYEMTSDDTIDLLCDNGPATGATSGTIKMWVEYTMAQK